MVSSRQLELAEREGRSAESWRAVKLEGIRNEHQANLGGRTTKKKQV